MKTVITPFIGILLVLLSTGCIETVEEQDLTRISQALDGEIAISVPPLAIGVVADMTLTGADADERVVLVRGTEMGDGGCPASLGGECLGVTGSIAMIGRSRANADGVAEFHWPVPGGAPEGLQFCMQAFIKRGPGGADSILSNVVCQTTCSGAGCGDCESDLDGDFICDDITSYCTDEGIDGVIMVEELNGCLSDLGAVFSEVEFIEVAYGHTEYLDQICVEMGWEYYHSPVGFDACDTSAYMYPSSCGYGWLGEACSNGCGNDNYVGFNCGGSYTSGADSCPTDPFNDIDGDGMCAGIDPCPFSLEDDHDGDGLCVDDDPCPWDFDNDMDGDGICGDVDICPADPENDIDGDGLCAEDDPCPYHLDMDTDDDGLCGDEDPCPFDALNDEDGDGLCAESGCLDTDLDGVIMVEELNACLSSLGAEFSEVEYIEVAYGYTDYLDLICLNMGWEYYHSPVGFDVCDTSAYMYPSSCGMGWLGGSCSNGCGNDNYVGFNCGGFYTIGDDPCPGDPDDDFDGDGMCAGIDPCPFSLEDDHDGDGLCEDADPCPWDFDNDLDGDGICGDADSCPIDPENDIDGDGLCAEVDPCPYHVDMDTDDDGLCGDDDPCPFDPLNDEDGDGECAPSGCTDAGADGIIMVEELNTCLSALGAEFSDIEYIEVAYGYTDYLDLICMNMGWEYYSAPYGEDMCDTSAYMYPSSCGYGWLGEACSNGCGNDNYAGFYCGGEYTADDCPDVDNDGTCDDDDPCPEDETDSCDDIVLLCTDVGDDGVIMVEELNSCLSSLGAEFSDVEYIEVAYGHTDYLDQICVEMGWEYYAEPFGGDVCSSAAYMYPSYCGMGWLGGSCYNGCGNDNYAGFVCGGYYIVGDDPCPMDPEDDADGDGICGDVDPCPYSPENDEDEDGLCGEDDPCPLDPENDADGDGLCADVDPCPFDAENDADGDGLCADVDDCPYHLEIDADGDGLCGDDDPCPLDPYNDADGDGICEEGGCTDIGGDGIIKVDELNACLMSLGAEFSDVEYIEVAYGHTDYLDQICVEMGWEYYAEPFGGDVCSSAAYMYPSYCGMGWLGGSCYNGCGNDNYEGFICGGYYSVGDDPCPMDPEDDADGDGICGDVDPCPYSPENDEDDDGLCGEDDPCPLDPENDADGDSICGDEDICPYDSDNDIDGDGICGDVDDCPYLVEIDADGDGLCGDDDPCPLDPYNDEDGDGICAEGGCTDIGGDGVIMVDELNACLLSLGAEFSEVEYIEVAYGHTDYLDQICVEMGYLHYTGPFGGDVCSSAAYMYPSYCGMGWLGGSCYNGCGNDNYAGFICSN